MSARQFMGITLALALSASAPLAAADRVIGAVAVIGSQSDQMVLQIKTATGETRSVRMDGRTRYIKVMSVTHQPYLRYTDVKAVAVGDCVDVEVRQNEEGLAKVVKIRQQPFDPCAPCEGLR